MMSNYIHVKKIKYRYLKKIITSSIMSQVAADVEYL